MYTAPARSRTDALSLKSVHLTTTLPVHVCLRAPITFQCTILQMCHENEMVSGILMPSKNIDLDPFGELEAVEKKPTSAYELKVGSFK